MIRIAALALLAVLFTGCSTLSATSNVAPGSPRYFAGTRMNVAALRDDQSELRTFKRYDMEPAPFPLVDLPFSFAGDAVLFLPALGYSVLTEPVIYALQ